MFSYKIINGCAINSPKGFIAGGLHCGIKRKRNDLSIISSKVPAICSAVYTTNKMKAPPLVRCEELTKQKKTIQAIVINSGNANSCTGEQGYNDAKAMAEHVAKNLNIPADTVLSTSTGVIGVFLPMDKISSGIDELTTILSDNIEMADQCANGIMTTDTFTKSVCVSIEIAGVEVKIAGIAKGSGMIHPNMATMLNFITTDVNIDQEMLDLAFKKCVEDSFNMITVDGDQSTNDMAVILANGEAKNEIINCPNKEFDKFYEALMFVMQKLAKDIAKDGEGASHLLECQIINAKTEEQAKKCVKQVLSSSLVKSAFFGKDANFGRIISAIGQSGVDFYNEKLQISFVSKAGKICLFDGKPIVFDEDEAIKIMTEQEITILISLGIGEKNATGWGCDLTYDYVKINASYRS